MNRKIVLWGKDATETRSLIALQIRPEDSKVDVWVFAEPLATEELGENLLFKWKEDKEFEFPEGFTKYESPLSVTESVLPEGITVDKPDLIQRAQTEWQFMVLSSKLNESYKSELEDLEERILKLEEYDHKSWESLKGFWDKVREQMHERNLFKEHAHALKERTNYLFDKMKELRTTLDAAFKKEAEETFGRFNDKLSDIEDRVAKNINLYNIFEELKAIQREFHNSKFTREMRNDVWKRIDGLFKSVKEKRFGPNNNNNTNDKTQRRFEGLLNAIRKMEGSIQRDQDELDFQNKRINSVHTGQLEMQLRQAKLQMIKDRISSKNTKLEDMYRTKIELEEKMQKMKARQEAEAAKQKEREAKKAAAQAARAEREAKAKAEVEAAEKAKAEAPVVEAAPVEPVVEEVKVEAPVVETETPVAEEAPKAETPAVEEPKIEEVVAEKSVEEGKAPQE